MTAPRRIGSLLAAFAACLCVIGGVLTVRGERPPDALDPMLAAAAVRRDELLARRTPASGEATVGSAARHYTAALQAVEEAMRHRGYRMVGWDAARHELRVVRSGGAGWQSLQGDAVAAWRWSMAPVLAELQRGARCADASGTNAIDRPFWSCQLSILARAEVALLLGEGRADDAITLWLDLSTFHLDTDQCPWPGQWAPDDVAALPTNAAGLLAQGLERIELRLLAPIAPEDLARKDIEGLRHRSPIDWHWQEVLAAWEHDFDPAARHLALYEAAFHYLPILNPAAPTAAGRDAQWQLFLDATALERELSSVVDFWSKDARGRELGRSHDLADLRTLQLGLAARLGRALPRLIDPHTDLPFRVDEDSASIVVHRHPPFGSQRWVRCP